VGQHVTKRGLRPIKPLQALLRKDAPNKCQRSYRLPDPRPLPPRPWGSDLAGRCQLLSLPLPVSSPNFSKPSSAVTQSYARAIVSAQDPSYALLVRDLTLSVAVEHGVSSPGRPMVIAHHILLFYPLSLPLAIGNFIYLYFCRPLEIRKLALSPLLRS
jgi:hypothetical protein